MNTPLTSDLSREERINRYLDSGPWGERRIEELILDQAKQHADDDAVVDSTGTTTYAKLRELTEGFASELHHMGLRAGDHVLLHMPNGKEVIILTLACLKLGIRPVFCLPAHRAAELTQFAQSSSAKAMIFQDLPEQDQRKITQEIPYLRLIPWPVKELSSPFETRTPPDPRTASSRELAFFQLSGGTTGASKLIPRHHREYAYSFLRSNEVCGFDRSTRLMAAIPLTHNFPMSSPGWMGVLSAGGCLVIPPASDASSIALAVNTHRVTHIQAVPPLVQHWLDAGLGGCIPSVRRILVGGARLAESTARRIHTELAPLQQVYGMAEGLVCYTDLDADIETICTTQGQCMSGEDELRVVDAQGQTLPPGELGELWTRGPYTISGYYRAPEHNARSFTRDGFYKTGDLVRMDAQGSIRVQGRVKEQINRGAEKISPAEVETFLLAHPGIRDACVVGEEDPHLGERVIAYLTPSSGEEERIDLDRRALRRYLRDQGLATFKIPERFFLVEALPETAVGKIHRRKTSTQNLPAKTAAGTTQLDGDMGPELDIIGIGFGPSNMALAVACTEQPETPKALFFEAQPHTTWHSGMLLPESELQVCFAKDLVTFRNPTSPFSFLNFLVSQGRIHDFFNRGSSSPLRIEFEAYLKWAANELRDYVRYSHRVLRVEPVIDDERITHYRVTVEHEGQEHTYSARNVVAAAGLTPNMPQDWPEDPRIFHSSTYLHEVPQQADPRTVVVVGGGQSGAEVALDLRSRFPEATIHLIHSRFGLRPADDTPFVNRIFDNTSVERLYNAPAPVRQRIHANHENTNYSVVNEETIQALYDAWYSDSWLGRERLVFHDCSQVMNVHAGENELSVEIAHSLDETVQNIHADLAVLATGYRTREPDGWLGTHAQLLTRDHNGHAVADRNYGLTWNIPAQGRFIALGSTQDQHGLSVTLLSNIALRAGEVLSSLTRETVPTA